MSIETTNAVRTAIARADSADNKGGGEDKLDKLLTALGAVGDRLAALEKRADDGLAMSHGGEHLDKLLSEFDSLKKRMDEYCGKMDAMGSRMDAFEKGELPAKREQGGKPAEPAVDKKADGEAQPGTESEKKALAEERKQDAAKADHVVVQGGEHHHHHADSAEVAKLADRLTAVEKLVPAELTEEQRKGFVIAQQAADRVALAFGDTAGAPRWLAGDTADTYSRRLASTYQKHSPTWKDVDLSTFSGSGLAVVVGQVYKDAIAASAHPDSVDGGGLVETFEQDRTGRRISKFRGSPEACWSPFKQAARLVTGINLNPQGARAH